MLEWVEIWGKITRFKKSSSCYQTVADPNELYPDFGIGIPSGLCMKLTKNCQFPLFRHFVEYHEVNNTILFDQIWCYLIQSDPIWFKSYLWNAFGAHISWQIWQWWPRMKKSWIVLFNSWNPTNLRNTICKSHLWNAFGAHILLAKLTMVTPSEK